MLGNQESQGEPQDQLASHLEPDQEVAAVLGTGETTWCCTDVNYNEWDSTYESHVSTFKESTC